MKPSSHSGPPRTTNSTGDESRSEPMHSEPRNARARHEATVERVRPKKVGKSTQRLKSARVRHAKQRVRATMLAYLVPTLVFSLVLIAMTSVVAGDWRRFNGEVARNEAQLKVLTTQLETGKRRLNVLESDKGREQLLIENGYLKPGERILLFPPDAIEKQEMQLAPNDLAPQPRVVSSGNNGSPWQRATRTIGDWFSSLRSSVK